MTADSTIVRRQDSIIADLVGLWIKLLDSDMTVEALEIVFQRVRGSEK